LKDGFGKSGGKQDGRKDEGRQTFQKNFEAYRAFNSNRVEKPIYGLRRPPSFLQSW
jgi:hypothetical protein